MCKLYNSLHVPVAVIADLDAICEPNKVESTLRALTRQPNKLSDCIGAIKKTANLVKQLPVSITEADVVGELKRLAEGSYSWSSGDDNKLRSELKKLDNSIYRIHRLKKGGVSAYDSHPEIRDALRETIVLCKQHGLFLVPCGELEEWVPSLRAVKPPPNSLSKTERACLIAELIREASNKSGDVWAFMGETLEYLRLSSAPSVT